MQDIDTNEIRDFINRAPKKWEFRGQYMVNNTYARLKWLSEIAYGTIHAKINRRAGVQDTYRPFHNVTYHAIRRHNRNERRKLGKAWRII